MLKILGSPRNVSTENIVIKNELICMPWPGQMDIYMFTGQY